VDLVFEKQFFPNAHTVCPCLCAKSKLWNTPLGRPMNVKEAFALQGFTKNLAYNCTDNKMKMLLGNSISVNVLRHLFMALLGCQSH